MGGTDWEHAREDKLATPAWLLRLAPDAKAMPFAMKELNQFVAPEHGQDNLKDVISQLTGSTV